MENKKIILEDLKQDIRGAVREKLQKLKTIDEIKDYDLHEIIKECVPSYTSDLNEMYFAAASPKIFVFFKKPTVVNCIASLVYEDLRDEAEQERQKILDEFDRQSENKKTE